MNFLNIRSKANMKYVPGELRDEFEKQVIELYCSSGKHGEGFWGVVPSLESSIVSGIKDKFILATLLGHGTGDMSFFAKETIGKVLPEFMDFWAVANMQELKKEAPDNVMHAYGAVELDAKAILDHYHMYYALRLDDGSYPGTGLQGFVNVPIIEVW